MLFKKTIKFNFCAYTKNQLRLKYEWVSPVGHDTGIKVYQEYVKDKVPLIFPNPNFVKWYMCGPTVYHTSHIGHASCYIKSDIIRRILEEYYGIRPVVAMGVTDLSEKIYKKAKELNIYPSQLSKQCEDEFFSHMKELNILPATFILRVQQHVPVITDFIAELFKKGAAYKTIDGSVYFKVKSDPNYGRFRKPESNLDQDVVVGKLNPLDFALWKSTTPKLLSPWGKGIPGWHIQCSAMASHVFGSSVDLHSGGQDLIFPHHENEEAQSTSFHRCHQWVNYWFHTGLLNMGDEKMSKSLDNFVSIRDFLQQYTGDHLRMTCMMSPYRNNTNYDERSIRLAVAICDKIMEFLNIAESYIIGSWTRGNINEAVLLEQMESSKQIVKQCLANDFAVHEALKCIHSLIKNATGMLNEKSETTARSPAVIACVYSYVKNFFQSFGFEFAKTTAKSENPSALETLIDTTVNLRNKVRECAFSLTDEEKREMMTLCDDVRDNLRSVGVVVSDLDASHAYWSLRTGKVDAGNIMKSIIDILVCFRSEIKKILPTLTSSEVENNLSEVCRMTQLYMSTIGVIIHDLPDGRAYWSFPNVDSENTSRFELIIDSTLKFYMDIKRIALSLTDNNVKVAESKENILFICDSAINNLQSYGISPKIENDSDLGWSFDFTSNKGLSLLQEVVDMIMHSREQVKSLSRLAKDEKTTRRLDTICFKTKKFLNSYGFNIVEPSYTKGQATWSFDQGNKNKIAVKHTLDILVMFMYEIKSVGDSLQDEQIRKLLSEMCLSLESNLNKNGIQIFATAKGISWSFKNIESKQLTVNNE